MAFLYASPTIQALRMPGTPGATITLKLPSLHFASFTIPKLHAAPKAAVIPPAAAPRRVFRKVAARPSVKRVPIVTDTHTNVATPSTPSTSKPDPFANAPVVDDEVGGVPTLAAGATPTPAPAPASAPAAPSAPATPPPAASSSVTYTFFSMSDDTQPSDTVTSDDQTGVSSTPPSTSSSSDDQTPSTDTTTPVTPPTTPTTPTTPATPATPDAGSVPDPSDPAVPVGSTTVTPPSTPQTDPPVDGASSIDSTTPDSPTVTSGDQNAATTSSNDPSVDGTTSSSSSGAAGSGQDATTDSTTSTTPDDGSGSTPDSVDPAASDPAATPGSGPSPPAAWTLTLDPTAASVTVTVDGTNLDVTVDGVVTSRPLADVASLTITGGNALSVDLGGGAISVPVSYTAATSGSVSVGSGAGSTYTYDGHSGLQVAGGGIAGLSVQNVTSISAGGTSDTLVGPTADTTWTISGANSGSVDSLSFSGIENLLGAANNDDTFVLEQNGSLSGGLDGGPGGYDTLVLDGTWQSEVSDPVNHSSGTMNLDGNVVRYAGLEPIANTGTVSDFVLNLPSASSNSATLSASGGQLVLSGGTFESTSFAAPTSSLTINLGSLGDTLTLGDISSVYSGSIAVVGGAGSDTFAAPDVSGTWDITGVDAGTYTWQTGPTVTFSSVENLVGAATQDDSFQFESGGAITGNVNTGGGNLTVGVAGFVQVSGTYNFSHTTFSGSYAGTSSGTVTDANVLTVSGSSGTGLVGLEAFSSPLGLQGTITSFGLAVVTDGTNAWDLFQGSMSSLQFVGLGDSFSAGSGNLTVQVNTGSGGTYLNTASSPIVAGTESLAFSNKVVSASTTFSIEISSFVYLAGTFTIGVSIGSTVNVETGLDTTTADIAAPGLTVALPSVSSCGSTLALTSDDSIICNLPVDALQFAASNVSVFAGYAPGGFTPTGPNGTLLKTDLPSDAIGLYASGVDVGLVLMGAYTTGNLFLDALRLKLYSLRATAGNVALVGIPDLTLTASNIDVQVNGGGGWPGPGSETVAADFGDVPGGYTIATGGTPITLVADGDYLSASVDQILLTIGDFVYVDGSFSLSKGATTSVDVSTGLDLTDAEEALTFGSLPVSASNPGGGELAVTEHGDELWNVPVDTIELGLGNVNVFVGYANGLALDSATNTIDKTALDAADAVGLYLSDGSLGLALMTADFPIAVLTEAPLLYGSDMKFTALRSDAGSVGLVGIPDITLTATNLEVDYNNGSSGSLWPGTPTADFVSTFGSGGLLVPDDTSGDTVGLDFSGGIIGASADNVLLQIGDFVYVSGSFAFSEGGEQWVDVASGLTGALGAAEFVGLNEYDSDPGGQTLGYDSGSGMIWNLPVDTINIGIGNASVFVGYSTGLTPTGPNNTLTLADVQAANGIGLLVSDVNLGLVLMTEDAANVLEEAPGTLATLYVANLRFYALTATAATAGLVGIPYVTATASGIQIRVNEGETGSAWLGNAAGAIPIVDFQSSFGSDGYLVPLSTTGTNTVAIPYTDEEIGASADQVLFQISQFVYLSGSFSFDEGPTLYVAVETGLTKAEATLNGLFDGIATASSAPADDSLAISPNGDELWNVPVSSITIGIASGNIFAGYLNGAVPLDVNGNISEAGLLSQGAVGLYMANVAVGLAMLRAPPLSGVLTASSVAAAAVSAAEMSFFSLKADAGSVALVGIPDLTLSSTDLEVRVNQGNAAGVWAGGISGAEPVVNYQDSFPSTNGLQIPTDTTGAHPPVTLDYTDTDIGASADQVLLEISQFVYVSGGFSFDKGAGANVDVNTDLGSFGNIAGLGLSTLSTYATAAAANGRLGVTSDYSMIWNLPVSTIQIGLHDVYVFAGYTNTPIDTSTGGFTHADLVNDGAIGIELQDANLGMVLMDEDTSQIPLTATLLLTDNLRFFALQATADSLGLIGVPEIQLNAVGVTVSVNQGTAGGAWPSPSVTGGGPPVIDFVQSFGVGGYQVPTDTSGDTVALTFTAPLIAGGAQHFTIQISSFVYLTGSLYFAKGGELSVPLTSGVIDDSTLTDLGLNTNIPGLSLTTADVNTMTIGASNVEAFVGVNGPYWNATNPDGIPDRDPVTGQIVSSEVNSSAIGLVIDNLTFGLFLGTPTLPGDPIRYAALKATASDVAFVGINGLTATAQNIDIEVNMSSPTLEGLPVLPVINFSGLPGGGYDVPTGAVNGDGSPVTVNLDYSTPLIEASSTWIQLDLFGVLDVQGSIAFALGPQETVTLSNGSQATLTTMTVGATDVSGFVGYDGPYITDAAGDKNSSAVGLSLDQASLGLFIGWDTASPQVYIAGHLNITELHLVGVPSAITLDGTASVDLDLGVGLLNGGTAINFAQSFPYNSTTNPNGPGFAVDTGDPAQPVVLDYTGFEINVEVAGTLALEDVFSLAGVLSLQADSSSLKILAAGAMTVGPDIGSGNPLVKITALGVFILNSQGIATDIDVGLSLGITDLGLTVNARLLVNSTGANQTIEIPGRLLDLIQADADNSTDPADATLASLLQGRLSTCGDGTRTCYTINGAAPEIFDTSNPNLTDVGILLGTETGTLKYLPSPGSYLVVAMSGTFNFLGFASATGLGAIEISAGNFQLAAQLNFNIGPISFNADGFVSINNTGVYAHIGISFDLNLLGLFDANLNGTLDINTQGSNDYFQLNLSGTVSVLSVLSLNGSFQFIVANGAWSVPNVSVSASLGPLSLTASGDIYSTGKFDLHMTGGINLGDCGGVGCVSGTGFVDADFDPGTGNFSFDVGGGLSAEVAGVSLFNITASGSAVGRLGQSVTLYLNVSGLGNFIEEVWGVVGEVASQVCSWLPWPLDDACSWVETQVYGWVQEQIQKIGSFSIPIATFSLPGGLTNVVAPPNLATQTGGVLTLNVGSRAVDRNVSQSSTNEDYEISSAGSGAVKITAFGTNQTFTGVTSITGNFGSGIDALILDPGMVMPVSVGGSGNAIVVGAGTNLNGLPGTGGAASLVVVDGGPVPLTVGGTSGSTLYLLNLGSGTGNLSSSQLTGFHTSGVAYSGFGGVELDLSPSSTLNVTSTASGITTTVNAGAGSATVNVGSSGLVSGLAGRLVFNGIGGENGVLNINDGSDTTGRSATLTSSQLTGLGTAGIGFSNLAQLNITLGSGANTVDVVSTAQTSTHIGTAGSSNAGTITIGTDLTQIQGPVTVDGGGADALVVNDSSSPGGQNGVLTSGALTGLGMAANAAISFSNLTALTITLGGTGNNVVVTSTPAGITTALTPGNGSDTVFVGGNSVQNGPTVLTGIQGTLSVTGHNGDTLQVVDGGDASARIGTLTSSTISGLGLATGGISYSGIGNLALVLGSGNDTFAVTSSIGGSTILSIGGGSDTLDLSGVAGTFALYGGDGDDTITVHSTNAGSTLTVNEGAGSNWVAILAANGTVIVNEGSGTDVVELGSNAAATPRGVDTGGNVNGIAGGVTVAGGSGSDSLYLDETGDSSSTGNDGTLTSSTITGLGLGAGITYTAQELVSLALGGGSTEFAVESTSTQTTVDTGAGNDTVDVSSDGKLGLGTLSGLSAPLTIDGQGGTDTLNISDFADAAVGSGRLTSSAFTGFGIAGIGYAGFEAVNVQLGKAADTLDVVSTYLQATTTIRAGPGGDTVNVSSDSGLLSGIAGHLVVDGQSGTGDVLNVSDAGDSVGQTGALTSTDITGLGLGTLGITYSGLTTLNITLGSGSDAFGVISTGATTNLSTGAGNDSVTVGAPAGLTTGLLGGIDNPLSIDGGGGSDSLTATDANDGTGQTGTLTNNFISGLSTADGIGYSNFELVTVDLGLGADTFTVLSTITGTTTVNGGGGNDSIDVETIAGPTFVNGDAGNDSITVNGDTTNPSTTNGIGALLTLDGGAGADAYLVNTFGNGTSTIDVFDTGNDGAANTLTINGTAADDVFLFRAGLVASLTGFTGGAYTQAEYINYTTAITGGLTVNGLAGDDTFAFDDNSAVTTVNGGDGNDTFQVGQIFGSPESFVTAVNLTPTTVGDLSNGVSYQTTLNGDNGADTFSIYHNMAPLFTNGGADNDLFVIRTFVLLDQTTTVSGGDGTDQIEYAQDAPVSIDGGAGTDTVVIFGTEDDDTFTITPTTVTGAGLQVTMTNIEIVRIDALQGNDTFIVEGTAPTVSTYLYGGLGSDTFDIGLNGDVSQIQGALYVSGGDDPQAPPAYATPILLPGEHTSPLPVLSNPNLNMIEANQVDTLNVNDGGVTSGQTGELTSSSVTGLGMDSAGIVYSEIEAVNVTLGSGDDSFAIESTIAGTTVLDAGAGNDSVSVVSIAGPTAVEGGAGNDTITVSNAAETTAGIASLLAVDGGSGTDTLVVDDSGNTADTLGTLTQTSLTGLDMVGAGDVQVYSVTPTTAFSISLAGFGTTPTLAFGATAAAVQAALQNLMFPGATCGTLGTSRCAQSVFVWQFGGDYLVGFEGEVGAAPPALTSTATDLPRTDGINYYDVESLSIGLGSGNDRFNVRGTSASTSLNTGAGDDVVYVSDSANLGLLPSAAAAETGDLAALQSVVLYGTLTEDNLTFTGTLDEIQGALTIDEGTGSNTLAVSDRGDTAARTAILDGSSIVGLAPAPITYGATGGDLAGEGYWTTQWDSGLFGRGIDIYGGSGGNTFTVTGTYASDVTPSPFGETLTSLFTGEGADVVTVSVPVTSAADLAVDGQGGDDTIDASASAISLLLFGGAGLDTITGGSGNDIVFGDTGRVTYLRPSGASGFDVVVGGAPVAAYQVAPVSADADFLTPDVVYTDGSGVGTRDVIADGNGNDLVFGGPGNDGITVGNGNDVVFGDDGRVVLDPAVPVFIQTQDSGTAGDDTIFAGDGNDVVLGGPGDDGITVGNGNDVVFGDDGTLVVGVTATTTDPSIAGNDTIAGGNGNDVVFGGPGVDGITLGNGNDTVFGDDGLVTFGVSAATIDPGVGDVDTIALGDGSDLVFGGAAGDGITAGNGNDTIFGDDGSVLFGVSATTLDPTVVGNDTIAGGNGNDVVFGGPGVDGITLGNGNDTVFGDDGLVTFGVSAATIDPGVGDVDTIGVGDGSDLVFGGAAGDGITAGNGNDTIFGDDGSVLFGVSATTLDPTVVGNDTIAGGNGNDVVFGGPGVDGITLGNGNDTVFGDDGLVTFGVSAATIDPGVGDVDTIGVGSGNDVVFGGPAGDAISSTGGHNVVFGDDGYVDWGVSELTAIVPTNPTDGAADTITLTGAGSNYVIGGAGGDTINTGPSDDLIFGDFGQITGDIPLTLPVPTAPATFTYTSVYTQNSFGGGNDVINAGDGRNIVIGGQGNDTITSGSGDDDLIGGSNVAGAQDGSDTIDGGAGNDVICGDNCSILPNGGTTNPVDRTLTASTIYTAVTNPDGTITYVPNIGGPAVDPTGALERTIVLFDAGSTDTTLYGNDNLAGGAGNDMIFGQGGNDVIQGDGSTALPAATSASAATDGNDYVEGGPGNDLIFGDGGQDILIGGSSDLFGASTPAQRPDGSDVIFGGDGTEIGLNDPGDSGVNAHSQDADVILGDNGDVYRLVGANGQYLTYTYDNYPGELEHIIPTAVSLLDYSPYGDASYVACDPANPGNCWTVVNTTVTNIGGADVIHGEGGNDVIYGETGNDQLFGDGQDDILYGNSGNDWMDGGTGSDGMLGDDGLLEPSRSGIAEPLFGIAATSQVTEATGDGDGGEGSLTLNVYDQLVYTALLSSEVVGGNDVMYGGLGNDFMHGGAGDDAMSGAAPLPYYYGSGLNPLGILSALSAYYTPGNVLGFDPNTGIFRYYNPSDPYSKIVLGNGVDFLLNFDGTVDDGQDAIFGDAGNDWIVGGTNSDYLFGGFGNDLLQADDNLDSTLVTQTVTYTSLCSLAEQYAAGGANPQQADTICNELNAAQSELVSGDASGMLGHLQNFENIVLDDGCTIFTGDQAATLLNLVQALMGTSPLANNIPDPRSSGPSNADIAYGGAGTDILIGNTAEDQLFDWNPPDDGVFVLPFRGAGDDTVIDDPYSNAAQFVLDLALSLGDDPVTTGDPARNGEPYGELGMVLPGDSLWPRPPHGGPSLGDTLQDALPWIGTQQDEDGSLGLPAPALTPSLSLAPNSPHWPVWWPGYFGLDSYSQALVDRLAVLGQLTPADVAYVLGLGRYGSSVISNLVGRGLIAPNGSGGYAMTQLLALDLGLADPPTITSATPQATPTTPVVVAGTGDAGDTISLYDGSTLVGTATVGADGTWSLAVLLGVGRHDLTATQTVNLPPNAGLTSAPSSCDVDVVVVPDAPVILGVVKTSTARDGANGAVSGTGAAGDVVTLYDGGHAIASATVAADGSWSVTVDLRTGVHVLTASQTAPGRLGSAQGGSVAVVVSTSGISPYAPPTAPAITFVSTPGPASRTAQVTVSGTGVSGDTILVEDGACVIASTTVRRDGTWSVSVQLGVGSHALTAVQEVVDGVPSAPSGAVAVTVFAPTPAPALWEPPHSVAAGASFTVVGSGVAGDTITLYDGSTVVGTTTVAADGSWTIALALAAGRHLLVANQTDPASHLVGPSSNLEEVDAYAVPTAASITGVTAGHGWNPSYTVSGTGVAGDTVTIYDGSTPIGSAVVGRNGTWSASVRLASGAHALSTTQTVGTYVTGPHSATVAVNV